MKYSNFLLACCCVLLWTGECFAVADYAKPVPIVGGFNIEQERAKVAENSREVQKEYQAEINKKNEQLKQQSVDLQKQLEEEMATADALDSQKNMANKDANKQAMLTCDCYNIHDSNTFEQNFLYDSKGIRIQRIYPECQCEPPPSKIDTTKKTKGYSDYVLPSEVTKNNKQQDKENSATDSSAKWNINY